MLVPVLSCSCVLALLNVGQFKPQVFIFRRVAYCSVCYCKIVRQSQFSPNPSFALFFSLDESLAGIQQQLQHQHLRRHQQECESAAAVTTAKMCRVQLPTLHVSPSISRDCCIRVCFVYAIIRVRVRRCLRVCAGTPHFSFLFFCSACCCCWGQLRHYSLDYWYARLVMMYACVGCVCVVYVHQRYTQQSHSMFVWTASVRVLCYVNM